MSEKFTHFNGHGQAIMVDVGDKPATRRAALATGEIRMQPETLRQILDHQMGKGDVFAVARLAGIMAAKQTASLIPLCHPLPLSSIEIDFISDPSRGIISINVTTKVTGRTGVEMEALTAVSITALTIYDMCKAIDRDMVIGEICLQKKTGGKSGTFVRNQVVGKIN